MLCEYGDGPTDAAWRGADGDLSTQWSSLEGLNSYWQATFQQPVTVSQVAMWGRGGDGGLSGRLEFSDGSTFEFGTLDGDGCRHAESFPPKTTTFVRFQVTGMGNRSTTGFRELQAYSFRQYPDGDDNCTQGSSGGSQTPPSPQKGQLYGLAKGTHIDTGPGFGYPSTIPQTPWGGVVPQDGWLVMILNDPNSPTCADGRLWWNVDRKAAGDPSGGTGWAAISQGCPNVAPPTATPVPPPGSTTPGNPPQGPQLGSAMLAKYNALGGASGNLGPITVGQTAAATSPFHTPGTYAAFQNGHMHASVWGVFQTHGQVDAKYLALGGSGGWLGFPIADQVDLGSAVQAARFEGGQVQCDVTGCTASAADNTQLTPELRALIDQYAAQQEQLFYDNYDNLNNAAEVVPCAMYTIIWIASEFTEVPPELGTACGEATAAMIEIYDRSKGG